MKTIIKKISSAVIISGILLSGSFSVVFAQSYDMGTTYPTYDMGTTYPTYSTGTTYPIYDTGTTYSNTPSYTYTPGYTYTTPTISSTYSSGVSPVIYDSSSYGYSSYPSTYSSYPTNYGTTNYGYSSYTYSNYTYPTVTTPSVSAPTTCPYGSTWNGTSCITNTTTCPSGSTLVNGSCVVNTTTCPSGSAWNGTSCITNTTTCPSGSHLSNGSCVADTTTCPSGSTLVNGVCQINNTSCPTGSTWNGTSCVINSTVDTYTCPNGSVVSYSFQCPIIYPVQNYTSSTYTYTSPVISYQTCWDGSTIPYSSVCPAQYKVCANGTSVPVNQTCYSVNNYVAYVPPAPIKFNNVITSVTTEITNKSGRCNGIGLIANGAQSTGWFEYGETSKLGRTTAPAAIGSSDTAPFSNVLVNLKPNTNYYCRAVMQNQYGTVKGEIVGFTTKSKATVYVKPVVSTPKKTTSSTKKNEIVCSDGTTISLRNQSSAYILNQGQKLIALQIEKIDESLTPGNNASYRLSYKNLSDSRLTNVVVKVTMPQEISFVSSSAGNYDEMTHTLTINQDTVDPYATGAITISGVVVKNAPIGKSVVTTAYVVYTVPSTSVQDEVTAYVVGSIIPQADNASSTGAKNVIGLGGDNSFLPNSLVEWLALIAIMFIIFILGRSIYASYNNDEKDHH